jgi:isopentenyldiphosphate isomerase
MGKLLFLKEQEMIKKRLIECFYDIKKRIAILSEIEYLNPTEEEILEHELNELMLLSEMEKEVEVNINFKNNEIRNSIIWNKVESLNIKLDLTTEADYIKYTVLEEDK